MKTLKMLLQENTDVSTSDEIMFLETVKEWLTQKQLDIERKYLTLKLAKTKYELIDDFIRLELLEELKQ